jgi:hypothetical protein
MVIKQDDGDGDEDGATFAAKQVTGICDALHGVTLRLRRHERDGPFAPHFAALLAHAGDLAATYARICTRADEPPPQNVLLAVGALARATGVHIAPHLATMLPALLRGLADTSDDEGVCAVAAKAVCDVCKACATADGATATVGPHADALAAALLGALAAAASAYDKAALVQALASMATVLNGGFMYFLMNSALVGTGFEHHVGAVLEAFHRTGLAATLAAAAAAEEGDEDEESDALQLRMQLLSAYPDVLIAATAPRVASGAQAAPPRVSAASLERVVEFALSCAADPALEERIARTPLLCVVTFILGAVCELPGGAQAVANAPHDVDELLHAMLAPAEGPTVAEAHLVALYVQQRIRALRPE